MYVRECTIRQEVCVKGFLLTKKRASELNGRLDKTHVEKVLYLVIYVTQYWFCWTTD